MDRDWRTLAIQRAEYVSDRLRGLMSSGLDFLRAELGVDLGLKPEKCPSWAILSAALVGLTLLLVVAACGRRKRRVAPVTASGSPSTVAETQIKAALPPKTVKTEPNEQKKRNKKKTADKLKAQANGQTVAEPKEEIQEIKVTEEKKPSPAPAQLPADIKVKKNKKKPKPEVKSTQDVSSSDGKEPDDGAWVTKVSAREKRQQRKKEKGPGDSSGSPESSDRASWKAEQLVAPATTAPKKNRESSRPKTGKSDAVTAPVTSNRSDVNTVNGGGWTEMPAKPQTQMNASKPEKLSGGRKSAAHKNRENSWKPESEGSLTVSDGKIKAELKPVNFTMLGLNTPGGEQGSQPNTEIGQWGNDTAVDNGWSSFNGLTAVDQNSDWNPPTELWDNYEPKVDTPVLKEAPVSKPLGEANDDKEKTDPAGTGKSRKKKKKKRPEEESSALEVTQEGSAPAEKTVIVKPHPPHVLKEEVSKQNVPPQSSQKKSDQNWEPPKQVQKKKSRRET